MNFDLKRPCVNCPFRTDQHFMLGREFAEQIADAVLGQGWFTCHKTVDYSGEDGPHTPPEAQYCAGALIVAEKMERPGNIMRVMERLGAYDHTKLDMSAPVYDDFDDWIEAQAHD